MAELNEASGLIYAVEAVNGRHQVRLAEGRVVPITIGQRPADFPPDWTPRFIFAGFAPVYLLELRHVSGAESTWFLSPEMERLAFDDPAQLPLPYVALLRQRGVQLLSALWRELFCAVNPSLSAAVSGFLELRDETRRRICLLCESDLNIRPFVFNLGETAERSLPVPLSRSVTLQTDKVMRIIAGDFLKQSVASIPAGRLSWESPAGSRTLTADSGLWLSDFTYMYRLVDREAGCVFYVMVAGHPCCVFAVYAPAYNLLFTKGDLLVTQPEVFREHNTTIDVFLVRHLCQYGKLIERTWKTSSHSFSLVFREKLISGQMWHDLTGIDLVTRSVPPEVIPEIIGMWGPLPEVYGRTEEIFPEIDGRINRSIDDSDKLARYAYANHRCLLRTTGVYVTRRLYTRVIDVNRRQPTLATANAQLAAIRSKACPLVLLGLRVENRTVVDLQEFCVQLIEFMMREAGEVAVVIDGHNSAGSSSTETVFGSELQLLASEQPIDVERRVISHLQNHFRGKPVTLIDNIGAPMSRSISWCNESDFFVTFYGTGLAKYRWACNKTGLVVTSQWTLRHQWHLHIYEADYLEDPTPLVFLSETQVEDLPDAPSLIGEPGNPPARWNFRVKPEGLFAEVGPFLRAAKERRARSDSPMKKQH